MNFIRNRKKPNKGKKKELVFELVFVLSRTI